MSDIKQRLDKHIKSDDKPIHTNLYTYPPELLNKPCILPKVKNTNLPDAKIVPTKILPPRHDTNYTKRYLNEIYPDDIIKISHIKAEKYNCQQIYINNKGQYVLYFYLPFEYNAIITNLKIAFGPMNFIHSAKLYILYDDYSDIRFIYQRCKDLLRIPMYEQPDYRYIQEMFELDVNKTNTFDILYNLYNHYTYVELIFDQLEVENITYVLQYDELFINETKYKELKKLNIYSEIKQYNQILETHIVINQLFLHRYYDEILNNTNDELKMEMSVVQLKQDIEFAGVFIKADELTEPNTLKSLIMYMLSLTKEEITDRIKILNSKLIYKPVETNHLLKHHMSIIDSKDFLTKCQMVDLNIGEIKGDLPHYDEIKTPSTLSEKRWDELINQTKIPHIKDFTALCSTVSTITKLALLLKLMKKCRQFEYCYISDHDINLEDTEIGFITNKLMVKFIDYFKLNHVNGNMFIHECNFGIPIHGQNYYYTEVCLTNIKVIVDLSGISDELKDVKITMKNPSYDSTEMLEFKQTNNDKYELNMPDIIAVLFKQRKNINLDIKFTSKIVSKPILIRIECDTVMLNSKAYDVFKSMVNRVDLKKTDNLLKFITKDDGGIRSEVPIINGNSNQQDNNANKYYQEILDEHDNGMPIYRYQT